MPKSPLYETDFMDWLTQQKLALASRDITAFGLGEFGRRVR